MGNRAPFCAIEIVQKWYGGRRKLVYGIKGKRKNERTKVNGRKKVTKQKATCLGVGIDHRLTVDDFKHILRSYFGFSNIRELNIGLGERECGKEERTEGLCICVCVCVCADE